MSVTQICMLLTALQFLTTKSKKSEKAAKIVAVNIFS